MSTGYSPEEFKEGDEVDIVISPARHSEAIVRRWAGAWGIVGARPPNGSSVWLREYTVGDAPPVYGGLFEADTLVLRQAATECEDWS